MDKDEAAKKAAELREIANEKFGEIRERSGEVLGELKVKGQGFLGQHEGRIDTAIDKVAGFVDDQTKGKYHDRIDSVTEKAKGTVGRLATDNGETPDGSAGNGQPDDQPK